MNIEKEIGIMKYQIKLLKTIIDGDKHPFHMYLLDHDITEGQHSSLVDVMIVMNNRLSQRDDEQIKQFFEAKRESLINRLEGSDVKINLEQLFSKTPPTFDEFQNIVSVLIPSANAIHLLKCTSKEEFHPKLSKYLLSQA